MTLSISSTYKLPKVHFDYYLTITLRVIDGSEPCLYYMYVTCTYT